MRATSLKQLLVLILLLTATVAAPAIPVVGPVAIAGDDNNGNGNGKGNDDRGKDKDDRDEDEDDGNRGHGNDDKKDKDEKDNRRDVTADAGYTVDVTCEPAEDGETTTCTYIPATVEEGKQVSQMLVPESTLCAPLVETSAEYVDPDPNMHETGYKSRGNDAVVTLALEGVVETAGTATYWVKAANTVAPASGPGLVCGAAATPDEPAQEAAPTTGTVVVEAFACADVPADRTGFDWYGACTPDARVHRFLLSQDTANTNPLLAAQTDGTGTASFTDLGPGAYHLEDADTHWCKAESDNVNADGNVVVEAGATSTVWLFYCKS